MSELQKLLDLIRPEMEGLVKVIENKSIPTTQNNYGDYYALIPSLISDYKSTVGGLEDELIAKLFALGLMKAGANRNGIVSAMSALGYPLH